MAELIVGLYDDIARARNAASELVVRGFDRDKIAIVAYDPEGEHAQYFGATEPQTDEEEVATGASIGAVAGGLAGLLIGVTALTIPGVGPVVAAGSIAATLLGAAAGAAAGGLIGGLVDAGIPEEEAGYFAEGVRRGGTLVVAEVPESRVEQAVEVMERHYPVDVDRRVEVWREQGWTGFDPDAEPYTREQSEREHEYYRTQGIGQEPIDARDFEYYAPAFHRHYESTYSQSGYPYDVYQPGYRYGFRVAQEPQYRDRDWEETEPEIRRRWEQEGAQESTWEEIKDSVRYAWEHVKQALGAEEDDAKGQARHRDYEREFRRDFERTYADTGRSYDYYQPAYAYGYTLAQDPRYDVRDWEEVEPEARRHWEEQYEGTWEEFRETVRKGWNAVKSEV